MASRVSLQEGSIVVFDLDGTLVDSARDLVATLNKVIAVEGFPPIAYEHVGSLVGQGALRMLTRAYEHYGETLHDDLRGKLHKEFLGIYEDHLADETIPFDGVQDLLDVLKDDGWILAVCTNKYEGMSKKLLEELNLISYFAAICGSDTFPVRKPDPAHLFGTIEAANGDPKRAIMIGDSITDISTAHAASIPVIGVPFGYSDRPIEELKPTCVVPHFDQMHSHIKQIAKTF